MRWVRYTRDGATGYGLVEDDVVVAVEGTPFDADWRKTERRLALDAVKIEIPLMPRTFYAAGLNYTAHVMEAAEKLGREPNLPEAPHIGYRAVNALIAHDEPVVVPKDATEKIHYEGELVVVIGKQAKHLTMETALDCVLGYTIGNDVSERSWQKSDRTLWRAKNTDTFKPMGPWIETDVDLDALRTTIRLNGSVSCSYKTNDMLYGVQEFLVAMTRYLTVYPGDVMWMGTDGTSPDLKDGDVVEVEISGIGCLRNPFMRER